MLPAPGSGAPSSSSPPSSSPNNPSRVRPRPPPLAPLQPPALFLPDAHAHAHAHDPPPQSPAVVLSPSTPDFPTGLLALGPPPPQPAVRELVPAMELPRVLTPPPLAAEDDDDDDEVLAAEGEGEDDDSQARRVRHSLMLLDSRLAEIESLGFGSPVIQEKADEVPATRALPADLSMQSLASFATTTTTSSEEDAFDIADFPSVDPLDSGYELDPSTIPRQRRRSSDIMAFPVPPALSSMPGTARPSFSAGAGEESVFAQLAQLGQRASVQGLGLFSDGDAAEFAGRFTDVEGGRTSRSSSLSESSTLSDKSFDASTLASSAANTSFGPRDKEFPPDLPAAHASWFAMSPPTSIPRVLPPPIDPVLANMSSAHPALASPFVGGSASSPSGLAHRPSPTVRQYSARSSSLPSQRSSSRAVPRDSDDNAPWALSPPAPITAETFVTSPVAHSQELEILADDPPALPCKEDADEERSPRLPPSRATTFGKTLRRLSSFGLLKKRKGDAVLQESVGGVNNRSVAPPQQAPLLSKRKSEAALSALLRSSKPGADKENVRAPLSPRTTAARPLVSPQQPSGPPNKLARRSASTPKLAAKFSAAAANSPRGEVLRPPLPTSPASFAGLSHVVPYDPAARPGTPSFGEGAAGTGTLKKRLSLYFNQLGRSADDSLPPVPPTPQEHLVAKSRAPAPTRIDTARANELLKEVSEPSSACTLEIASPAPASSLFSEDLPGTSSPATSAFPTPSLSSASAFSRPSIAASLKDKPLPVPLPTSSLSAPAHQSGFVFPPLPSSPRDQFDPRLSLYGFMRATEDAGLPAPTESGKRATPAVVFPSTRLAQERSSARQGASESRSSSRIGTATGFEYSSPRPASPLAFPPQEIVVFPVRIQREMQRALPPGAGPPGLPNASDGESSNSEDEYGSGTDDSDEDKPLGVVVPGALTAQKSLRLTAAKQSRSERKAREAQEMRGRKQGKVQRVPNRREDPFELEHAAAMVSTPPPSMDGHGAPSRAAAPAVPRQVRPQLSPVASASSATVQSVQSAGHDALLPQSDASLERRAASNGMTRSPSTPLDPMVADSALTIDSPEILQGPHPHATRLPFSLASPKRQSREGPRSRSPKPEGLQVGTSAAPLAASSDPPIRSPTSVAPPKPSFRPPPVPTTSSSAMPSAPPFDRRPSLAARSSDSPTSSPSGTPLLGRRPSRHPDLQPGVMKRQASSSSAVSSTAALSRAGTLSAGSRSRSTTVSSGAAPPVETRVYLDAAFAQFVKVNVTDRTLAGEVVAFAKAKGALAKEVPGAGEGGWALWEAWRSTGIERPMREYELVADVTRSWDEEGNAFFFRRTTMWPILSAHARSHPPAPKSGAIQLEVKKGKWSKRFLHLKEGTLSYTKAEKGKDVTTLCQLSNFDVFLVSSEQANRFKAPRPFVFALKSRLTRAHFEETSEWCHFLCTKTPDEAASWVKSITEAGNPFARIREQAVLGATSPTSPTFATSSPLAPVSLLASAGFSTSDAPPVPAVPAGAALARNPTLRPIPPSLAGRSYTAPLPPSVPSVLPPGASLSRAGTVVKPDARQWGAMGESQRQEWLIASERAAKQTKTPLVDLSR